MCMLLDIGFQGTVEQRINHRAVYSRVGWSLLFDLNANYAGAFYYYYTAWVQPNKIAAYKEMLSELVPFSCHFICPACS